VSGARIEVRLLAAPDAEAVGALRREALSSSPLAFASSPEDDRWREIVDVRRALEAAGEAAQFGAFDGQTLVGMVGIYRPEKTKMRHRAEIWGMYVAPRARGRGAGEALLAAAVALARTWPGVVQVQLSVSETAVEARRLYERAGFREWGREPRALSVDGRFVDETHMVLELG
jgi:ribosomal protein S18 acetylase RimI-like enzyme